MTTSTISKDSRTAQTKYLFPNGFRERIDFSLLQSNTWINCAKTNVVKATVCAYSRLIRIILIGKNKG